jgi:hypothetical protein
MTKMPLGTKLAQNDSNAIFEMGLNMELKQGFIQYSGIKMSLNAGNV